MSVSTLDSLQSVREQGGYFAEQDERERAVQGLKDEFLAAVRKGDLSAVAYFAPVVPWCGNGRRHPNVGEVLLDAIDYSDFSVTSMRILCAVAKLDGAHGEAARELFAAMGAKWADHTYEGE